MEITVEFVEQRLREAFRSGALKNSMIERHDDCEVALRGIFNFSDIAESLLAAISPEVV